MTSDSLPSISTQARIAIGAISALVIAIAVAIGLSAVAGATASNEVYWYAEALQSGGYEIHLSSVQDGAHVEYGDLSECDGSGYAPWNNGDNFNYEAKKITFDTPISPTDTSYLFYGVTDIGNFGNLDMSNVVNAEDMFYGAKLDHLELKDWVVPDYCDVTYMFEDAEIETADLSGWVNVDSMYGDPIYNGTFGTLIMRGWDWSGSPSSLYFYCTADTLVLDGWNLSGVETTEGMFQSATIEALSAIGVTVSAGTSVYHMFSGCALDTLNLSDWDASSLTSTTGMFYDAHIGSANLSGWDVSSLANAQGMFMSTGSTPAVQSLNISGWTLSAATDLAGLLGEASGSYDSYLSSYSQLTISGWSVPAGASLANMFAGVEISGADGNGVDNADVNKIDLSDWDVSEVASMESWFENARFKKIVLEGWDVSNLESTKRMFCNCTRQKDSFVLDHSVVLSMSGWTNAASVSDISEMFAQACIDKIDLSAFNGCSIQEGSFMFVNTVTEEVVMPGIDMSNATNLVNFFSFRLCDKLVAPGWTLSSSTDTEGLFFCDPDSWLDDYSGRGSAGEFSEVDFSDWDIGDITSLSGWFCERYRDDNKDAMQISKLDLSGWNTSDVTDFSGLFSGQQTLAELDIEGWDLSSAQSTAKMFYECALLTEMDLSQHIDKNDPPMIGDAREMFHFCDSLEYVNLDGFGFVSPGRDNAEQSLVTLGCFLASCPSLKTVDMNGCYLENIYSYGEEDVFRLITDDFDNLPVVNMYNARLKGDHFDGLLYASFSEFNGIETWDTSELVDASELFFGFDAPCASHLDLSGWDTSSLECAAHMFREVYSMETLNLAGWDFSHITNIREMFENTDSLTTIYTSPGVDWNIDMPVAQMSGDDKFGPFSGSIVGGQGTGTPGQSIPPDDSPIPYARVDGLDGKPGYFTAYVPPVTREDVLALLDSIDYVQVSADGLDVRSDDYWTTQSERDAIDAVAGPAGEAVEADADGTDWAAFKTALEGAIQAYDAAKKPGLAVSAHIKHVMKTSAAVDDAGIVYSIVARPLESLSAAQQQEGGRSVPAAVGDPAPLAITPASDGVSAGSTEYTKVYESDIVAATMFGHANAFGLPGIYFFTLEETCSGGSSAEDGKWVYGGERYLMRVYLENDEAHPGSLKYSSISLHALDEGDSEGSDKIAEASFTSSYAAWQTLTVSKQVEGAYGSKVYDFSMEVTLVLPEWYDGTERAVVLANASQETAPSRNGDTGPFTGTYSAALHSGESATFTVPVGTYYKIEEKDSTAATGGIYDDAGVSYDVGIAWAVAR